MPFVRLWRKFFHSVMLKGNQKIWLPRVIIMYMLLALLWWSWLLFRNNSELTASKLENLQLYSNIIHKTDHFDIRTLPEYKQIMKRHDRKKIMVIGEALVFGFTLILGMYLITHAYRKEMENSMRQNNFLLSITHELKSPLTSVQLILETFSKRKLKDEQIRDLSSDALMESKRLEKQINNLLMAAKLDKAYTFNFQKEDIINIISDIVKINRQTHPEAHIDFNVTDQPIIIHIDREGFYSIINNIVENAIKYSDKDINISIDIIENHKEVTIHIKDAGIGIDKDARDKIFDQFYRAEDEEIRRTKGTGLGLYIVKKLVDAHKAKISVSENLHGGSIFTLQFPK